VKPTLGRGAVLDDIDRAEPFADGLDQAGDLLRCGQVGGEAGRLDALGAELVDQRVEAVLAPGHQGDAEAVAGETTGDGGAEAGAGTEDHDHFGHGYSSTCRHSDGG
jgi:hypothetical protein